MKRFSIYITIVFFLSLLLQANQDVCKKDDIHVRVETAMMNETQTRHEVLSSRIWGDERVPMYWNTKQTIPLESIAILWREACWYGFAKQWWIKDNVFFILEEPDWNGQPFYILHLYAIQNDSLLKISDLRLYGLGDSAINEENVRYKNNELQFHIDGYQQIIIKLENVSCEAREIIFKKIKTE